MFAVTAMSLGLENDDLLFNLLYFGGGEANFGTMFNSAMEETVALYSENNTPYKLRPADEDALGGLECTVLSAGLGLDDYECSICKDDMEMGCDVTRLPACRHCFHFECVVRWLKLQGWCPVCRAPIKVEAGSTREVAKMATLTEEEEEEYDRLIAAHAGDEAEDFEEILSDRFHSKQHLLPHAYLGDEHEYEFELGPDELKEFSRRVIASSLAESLTDETLSRAVRTRAELSAAARTFAGDSIRIAVRRRASCEEKRGDDADESKAAATMDSLSPRMTHRLVSSGLSSPSATGR